MRRLLVVMCLIAPWALAQAPASSLDRAAQDSYEAAVKHIQAGRYRDALGVLNQVAQTYPRVAEIFASRCSAQIGLGMNPGAEADCNYAVTLKPTLSSAVFGLAVAEDNQGKNQAAVRHYQQYSAMPDATPALVQRASARIQALNQAQLPVADVPMPPAARPAPAPTPAVAAPSHATLFVYRNHLLSRGNGPIPIMVDSVLVGDLLHDSFVEIQLPAGDHTVDACLGGLRQRSGLPNIQINTGGGSLGASISTGSGERLCVSPFSLPIQVRTAGPTYVNFDTQGYDIFLQERPPAEADAEMRHDCRKAFTKKL